MAQKPEDEMTFRIGEIKWEYLTHFLGSEFPEFTQENSLNHLGSLGWELVTVIMIGNNQSYLGYFKRPIWNPE